MSGESYKMKYLRIPLADFDNGGVYLCVLVCVISNNKLLVWSLDVGRGLHVIRSWGMGQG